ncbi:1024_t:CDS:1, partial [Entrophospora sp. SA101]
DWPTFVNTESYQKTLTRVDSKTLIEAVSKRIKIIEKSDDLLNGVVDFIPENGFIAAKLK